MDAVDPGRMVYVYHRYLYYECEDRIQHPMGRRLCDRRMRSGSLYRCDHLVRQKACGGEEGKSGIQRKEEKIIESEGGRCAKVQLAGWITDMWILHECCEKIG